MGDEAFDFIGLPFNDAASINMMMTEMNDSSGRGVMRASYTGMSIPQSWERCQSWLMPEICIISNISRLPVTKKKPSRLSMNWLPVALPVKRYLSAMTRPVRHRRGTGGMLPAPKGKRFIMTEQQTLLSHGVATAYVEGGTLRIQRSVTTYKKNAYGVADNSYLDSETLHTSAYVLRKLKSVITSKYGRHKLANDGTRFGPGQAIVTPAVIKGELLATYRQMERAGIVENYDLFKQYLIVERDADNPNPTEHAVPAGLC